MQDTPPATSYDYYMLRFCLAACRQILLSAAGFQKNSYANLMAVPVMCSIVSIETEVCVKDMQVVSGLMPGVIMIYIMRVCASALVLFWCVKSVA